MTRTAVVIGGGLAGLSAGVALTDAGWRVTVIERRDGLGGRARSFTDPVSGDVVDNGQHVFVGCYRHTRRFLRRLGTEHLVAFQDRLDVAFAEPGRLLARLRSPNWPAPWHLVAGAAGLSTLSWRDKLALGRVVRAACQGMGCSTTASLPHSLDQMTVEQWLVSLGQSARSRQVLWDPLAIAALNDEPAQASALGFAAVVAEMFGGPAASARLGIASVGLTELYATAAARVIADRDGLVRDNAAVMAIDGDGRHATAIRLASGEHLTADAYLCAVPPHDAMKLLPPAVIQADSVLQRARQFTASPIVSINLWFDRPITDAPFVGFIGTTIHWLFNRPQLIRQGQTTHVTVVISAAGQVAGQANEALVTRTLQELQACLPGAGQARLLRSQVVREPYATVKTPVGSQAWRPGPRTAWPNLYLAGDWTNTGLPATIESAVLSGIRAAEKMVAQDLTPR